MVNRLEEIKNGSNRDSWIRSYVLKRKRGELSVEEYWAEIVAIKKGYELTL